MVGSFVVQVIVAAEPVIPDIVGELTMGTVVSFPEKVGVGVADILGTGVIEAPGAGVGITSVDNVLKVFMLLVAIFPDASFDLIQ